MIVIKHPLTLQRYLFEKKDLAGPVGFVPTMGALHPGHIELIQQARNGSGLVVCSIFVNPTQFNDPSDYQKYPKSLEQDLNQLELSGTDILFLPSVDALYPGGLTRLEQYDLGHLETILEGFYRPGHFQGVCQVMSRLLSAVEPDLLFMGQKDYQQCMVVTRLIELMQIKTKLITCPTVREADGLAMSSRNKRLTDEQRRKAVGIYRSLIHLREHLTPGPLSALKKEAEKILKEHEFRTDYVEITDATTLQSINEWDGQRKLVALVAAFQQEVRLIDNMRLNS